MDISALSSTYLDQATQNAQDIQTQKMQQLVNQDYATASDAELMEACKQFESYLLEQVFKKMNDTTKLFSDEEDGSSSMMVDYFMESTIQDIANTATEKEGLGIAQTLYEAMKRNYSL